MSRKLLIVDDINTNREILKKLLGSDYEILEAANGREAMTVMESQYASLSAVLLDLAMPVMNGFEVLSRMRGSAELSHIPVIVTTGQTEVESEVKALALGANDYITKPYNSTIIKQRIKNTINLRETAATVNALQRDKLTGLYNREVFFEKSAQMIAEHAPGYYVMASFDIDSFKVINDQYGTEMGDEVLRHVGRCIDEFIVPLGGLCCRVTADNFAVLYPAGLMGTDALRQNHRDTTMPPCLGRSISIRIGRYIVTDTSLSASAMYDRATLAELSVSGRYDVYVGQYDESMRTHILREQEIVNEMNGALADGQFEVWFQPQFNHATGAMIGAEGLVRWRHPQRGLVSPAEFIPIFERNGFIYELDKYVWEQTCAYLRKWLDEDRAPLPVSVNVSRYDLLRDDLVGVLTGLVARHRIPVDLMRLEITESAFAGSSDQIIDVVEALVQRGFAVEIDDFGSGYSSLNTLKDVPASILKLDMRFLESGRNSARGGNILESIVRMAKWLGMPVIAEGVETVAQADYLKSIGCYYVQGYLYAKPMPAGDYEAYAMRFGKEQEMLTLETVDNLNNSTFWDPRSMDTLIFNTYVGGACIFEYHNGRTELLRINENYVRELGAGALSAADAHGLNLTRHMDAENRARLESNILRAIRTGKESSCEVLLTGIGGAGERTYIRTTVRVIATAGARHLLYCSIFNMSELRETERKEHEASVQMQVMMDDTPGGFCRIRMNKGGRHTLLYVNEGLCELIGMTHAETMAAYADDALGCLHPEDREALAEETRRMLANGGQFNAICRLRRGDGAYIEAVVFGRSVRLESGETYMNLYLNDISEQARAEAQRRELLDNLPCGAAFYRFTNGTITAVHLNRRYQELVGRAIDDPAVASVTGAVHPDDRGAMLAEVKAAIAEKRDILCDIRLRYADSAEDYRPFRIYGRSIDDGDGVYSIYAVFLQITEEKLLRT